MATWVEWEGNGIEGNFVFMTNQWFEDSPTERALLAHSIRTIGVTESATNAHTLANSVSFHLAWYGFLEGELYPDVCDELGFTFNGDEVDTARQCTFAVLESTKVNA